MRRSRVLDGTMNRARVAQWIQRIGVKSIQAGTVAVNDNAASGTATINSVDTNNSILIPGGWSWSSTTAHSALAASQELAYMEFTNPTTITAKKSGAFGAGANALTWAFSVIEFYPGIIKSVQRGVISFGTTDVTKDATINAVNTAKAVVMSLGMEGGAGGAAGDGVNVIYARLALNSSTVVRATRGGQNGSAQTAIEYQVIEFY